jgi:hypothetical protein
MSIVQRVEFVARIERSEIRESREPPIYRPGLRFARPAYSSPSRQTATAEDAVASTGSVN